MVFTIVTSIEFTSRKYKNMKMVIRHITTHFVVEGHILAVLAEAPYRQCGLGG